MARLVIDGASKAWTPVKMVDTFKGLVPGFGEAIDQLTQLGREHVDQPAATAPPEPQPVPKVGAANGNPARALVETYGKLLGERSGVQVTEGDLEAAGLTAAPTGDVPTLEQSRGLLDPVTNYVQGLAESKLDPVVVSDTRLDVHRILAGSSARSDDALASEARAGLDAEPLLVEVEFVAIYW